MRVNPWHSAALLTPISAALILWPMTLTEYLKEAQGGGAALASALGVVPELVSQWKTGARRVPAERCPDIERATGSAVRCEDLRPDIDWAVLREQAAPPIPTEEARDAA